VRCEVMGKLIMAVLIGAVSANAKARIDGVVISFHKAARHARAVAVNWAQAILRGVAKHEEFIANISIDIGRLCKKTESKLKPTIEERLAQDLLDQIVLA